MVFCVGRAEPGIGRRRLELVRQPRLDVAVVVRRGRRVGRREADRRLADDLPDAVLRRRALPVVRRAELRDEVLDRRGHRGIVAGVEDRDDLRQRHDHATARSHLRDIRRHDRGIRSGFGSGFEGAGVDPRQRNRWSASVSAVGRRGRLIARAVRRRTRRRAGPRRGSIRGTAIGMRRISLLP